MVQEETITSSRNYKREGRLFVGVFAFLVVIMTFVFKAFYAPSIEKDINLAANREYIEGVIYDESVPLAGSVGQNGISIAEADTVANKQFSMQVFNRVNEIREDNNLEPLTWSEGLYNAGLVRAVEIVSSWSHTRPSGNDWWTVDANIMYGENLGRGYNSPDELVTAWMNSPEHRDNILFGFNTMAISTYRADDGSYYVAQEFGY